MLRRIGSNISKTAQLVLYSYSVIVTVDSAFGREKSTPNDKSVSDQELFL